MNPVLPQAALDGQHPYPFFFSEIEKRDGRVVSFDASKITAALLKAGKATGEFGEDTARQLTMRVLGLCQQCEISAIPTVESIQDVVEEVLLMSPFKKTAKAYILYRDQHARVRELISKADVELIDRYLERLDWKVRENSNMAYSLQGLNNYISSEVSKTYWLNKIYTKDIREAHDSGDLHIHDLGLLSVYCVGWDLQDLLRSGFCGAPGKAESSPPRHFRSALGQIVNFFYTLQGEAAGAQAFSNFDTLLAPFIRHDNLDFEEVKQALQEFVFNLNVATRVGFQTPFTNLTMDLQPPSTLANTPIIIGGENQDTVYGDYQHEMTLLNSAFLEVLAEGDAKGRVFSFPIPTYNITPDFDWERPGLDQLWEVTARYGIPYFANFINSDMSADDARSMCCRLRLDLRTLEKRGGGLFGANPLTGSVGVVTINMPRLGYLATSEEDFFSRLDRLMDLAKESLETKRKILEAFTAKSLYPYTKFYLRDVYKRFDSFWHNHFSTVGLVGMNEACLNLIQKDIGTEEGAAFACRVLDHMRDRLSEYQEETGSLYNLEATPAEGTAYRLARLDRQQNSGILFANHQEVAEGAEPFYTNSTQLPVNYTDDIFQVFDLQDALQTRYTGGTVLHVFLGEAAADPQAVKAFVKKVCENYSLPYFTVSPSFSICPTHGYLTGEHPTCPDCGNATEVYARIVGYLRPINQWNEGKQAEFEIRRHYSVETPETTAI
ncbi:MAG: ribonucleoside triphosphate reductase [Candidatus Hydrogenedens sp.]|jgi:ribonucleoside-triphosphate reductase|nr:ribonucleoside triphosphate reductase [Candidatus Hydrogenedens sp.]